MLIFLKLGGSLITDKSQANTARMETLVRLAEEISEARQIYPEMKLIIGHGSGSFGHTAGKKYGTRDGVQSPLQWKGFVEVWNAARQLNQIVIETLLQAGLPIISFPPSSFITTSNHKVATWNHAPIRAALYADLIPVIFGDVIFDSQLGGTILSTEEVFFHLAHDFLPKRILIAGMDEGVWNDYSKKDSLIELITPSQYEAISSQIGGSNNTDVTGGMAQKVKSMIDLIQDLPETDALIFSGNTPNLVRDALLGANPGTIVKMDYEAK